MINKVYVDNPDAVETINCTDVLEEYTEDVLFVHDVDATGILKACAFNLAIRAKYPKYYADYQLMVEQAEIKAKSLGDVILTDCDNKVFVAGIFGSYRVDKDKPLDVDIISLRKGLVDIKELLMTDKSKKYPRRIVLDSSFGMGDNDGQEKKEEIIKMLHAIFDYSCAKVLLKN